MKLIKKASGDNYKLEMTKDEWLAVGEKAGWITEAKKKSKTKNNPWAICTESVGREDKEKYERCVKDVKKQK